jgi:hypothetical protein
MCSWELEVTSGFQVTRVEWLQPQRTTPDPGDWHLPGLDGPSLRPAGLMDSLSTDAVHEG